MIVVVFMGGAVEIYTFSNVGYLASFLPVLVGYYLLRRDRPNLRRPFRLPEFMKYVALGLAALLRDHLLLRRPRLRVLPVLRGQNTLVYYLIGIATSASPTCRSTGTARTWRTRGTRRRPGRPPSCPSATRSGVRVPSAPPSVAPAAPTPSTPGAPRSAHPARVRGAGDPAGGVEMAAELARGAGVPVHVFAVARIYGSRFGFPIPWLRPNASEWQEQRDNVTRGDSKALGKRGVEATAQHPRDAQGDEAHRRRGEAARVRRDRDGRRPAAQPARRRPDVVAGAVPRAAPGEGARSARHRLKIADTDSVEFVP